MGKKLSFEEVKKLFDDKGYILLETEYVNAHTKMKYICSKHKDKGVQEITVNNIRGGKGCCYCGQEHRSLARRLNFNDVKKIFEQRGYILLETKYTNAHTNMKYICPKHEYMGVQKITVSNLKQGQGCKYCGREKASNALRLSFDDVKQMFEQRGYELLETKYVNVDTPMKYICPKHKNKGVQKIRVSDLKSGRGCYYCGREQTANALSLSFANVKALFDKCGYELLDTKYINSSTPMKYICSKHKEKGIQQITYGNLSAGKRCRYCSATISRGETKVEDVLMQLNVNYVREYTFDDCKNKRALPFDFYLPNYNVCVEYDGQQHYAPVQFGGVDIEQATKEFEKTQEHDEIKTQYCIDHNIHLIRIPYWDFDNIEKILKKELNIT